MVFLVDDLYKFFQFLNCVHFATLPLYPVLTGAYAISATFGTADAITMAKRTLKTEYRLQNGIGMEAPTGQVARDTERQGERHSLAGCVICQIILLGN